jgi:hypothetical protein
MVCGEKPCGLGLSLQVVTGSLLSSGLCMTFGIGTSLCLPDIILGLADPVLFLEGLDLFVAKFSSVHTIVTGMTAADYNVCDLLGTLTDVENKVIEALYRKLGSLRRLAELLEKAGDITGLIGAVLNSLPSMIPVQLLRSFEAYNRLREFCPMLGLPPAGIESTADLQTKVATAYSKLIQQLDLHQYNRLDKLQARLDSLVAEARSVIGSGTDWMICAKAMCDAIGGDASITGLKTAFNTEVARVAALPATAVEAAKKPFRVLDDEAIKKVDDLKRARVQLIALGQSENADIQATFDKLARKAS